MAKGQLNQNWKKKILEWKASGKNARTWSKENNIPYTTLLGWKSRFDRTEKKQLFVKQSSASFIELKDQTPSNSGIYLEYQQIKICLQPGFDPIVLKQCLNCLRGASC
jgi:hypothetical protein